MLNKLTAGSWGRRSGFSSGYAVLEGCPTVAAVSQERKDVLEMLSEMSREAGLLGGVFGVLDCFFELAKDPAFDAARWLPYVLCVSFVVAGSGIVVERIRPIRPARS
jgi:hypothetical protein